ncbi:MAG: flagellar biosynthesis protein [Firmicutes bacterium]|nr:flagellar biosynthesis protein [Bacillota bacterium]
MSKIIKGAFVETNPLELQIRKKLRKLEENPITPEEKIKLQLEDAERQGAETIKKAQQQAEQLLEQARTEGEKLKQEAQQQGYQQGVQQAENEAVGIRRQAQSVLEQAEETRRQTLEAMEQEITSLAVEIAEKYISVQLQLNPDIITEVAKEAIQLVKDREQVTIYVNPEELQVYLGNKQQLQQALSDRATLNIISDSQVKPGGCMVTTEKGVVDATADSRWYEILKAVNPA